MSEFAGGAGIVGAIEVNVRTGVHFFEPAGPDRVCDPPRDGIIGDLKAAVLEEPRGGGGVQGVLELETAGEARSDFEDRLRVRFNDACADATVLHGFSIDAKDLRWLDDRAAETFGASKNHFAGFRLLPGEDERDSGFQDPGFFYCDFAQRMAEKVFVVKIDASDDGDDRYKDIGGIETAAHADFEDGDVHPLAGKIFESHGGYAFEISGMGAKFACGKEFFDQDVHASKGFGESLVADLRAINAHAFGDVFEIKLCGGGLRWGSQFPSKGEQVADRGLIFHFISAQEQVEGAGDEGLELLAVDDGVEETVFEEEFGALKSFGEFLADGLLDDARAGKTDERAGFADVEVAEHGEAGGDAARGGVGEHRDIGQFFVIEAGKRGGHFRELHEADGAFHHARAAGTGDGDERLARFHGEFDSAGHFFSDDSAHRAADESELHRAEHDGTTVELAFGGDDRVIHAELFLGFFQARRVRLGVDELERVGRGHACVVLGPAAIEQHFEALLGVHLEVKLTLRTDVEIFFEILSKNDGAAGLAFDP